MYIYTYAFPLVVADNWELSVTLAFLNIVLDFLMTVRVVEFNAIRDIESVFEDLGQHFSLCVGTDMWSIGNDSPDGFLIVTTDTEKRRVSVSVHARHVKLPTI